MTNNYQKLQKVLTEVFQLDKAELDFGIYRIMNQKRKDVEEFLTEKLPSQVRTILEQNNNGDTAELQKELDKTLNILKEAGVDPDSSTKVKELQSKIDNGTSIDALEQEVFSHLASFFKRYYQGGDFISLRRYKKDVYAIPYEGEEVKLHWANHDQYYIKTSEYLKNYAFKLPGNKIVKFELKEASTEQNNNKAQKDKERRFALYEENPVTVDGDTLIVNFTYEPQKKSVKQEALIEKAISNLSGKIPTHFHEVFTLKPTEKNKKRTLLGKHINDYTARNSFDYFIHKDLGGFLRRELDFYIKNEVLFIDDINTENEVAFSSQISKIKALKQVAGKIIQFLEQLENFQKKLWLKKKFVLDSDYCITLDRIPEEYYPEILKNIAQLDEWIRLFSVKISKIEDLKNDPFLILDTKFFPSVFKDKLMGEFDNIDELTTGLLINSENFQALNFIQSTYKGILGSIYIDPPYNTKSSEIAYKNNYKHSSWLSLMDSRLKLSRSILKDSGLHCLTIDDLEMPIIWSYMNDLFGVDNHLGTATIRINPGGRKSNRKLALQHEYALFMGNSEKAKVSLISKDIKDKTHTYKFDAEGVPYEERNLRKEGADSLAKEGADRYYPIYYDSKTGKISTIEKLDSVIWPMDTSGERRIWRRGKEVIDDMYTSNDLELKETKYGMQIYFKFRGGTKGEPPRSFWSDKKYSASEHGTQPLDHILGQREQFSFPKSIFAVMDCLKVLSSKSDELFLDYFSGSGTTGHAVLKLNREDDGNRKYILVEMGEYFNTVTKPRIQKVIYSDNWKNGKPQDKLGVSQMFKYMSLESYEDGLNNLELQRSQSQQNLLSGNDALNEEYLLQYMLDVESRGHLLNLEAFKNPFKYQLMATENNELIPTTVDLVETFNYLLGLHVKRVQRIGAYKTVEGITNKGEKVLVIWRNLEETTNEDLERFIRKADINVLDGEFDTIYVNGDNNLANFRKEEDTWKVLLTEEIFFNEMFDVKDI